MLRSLATALVAAATIGQSAAPAASSLPDLFTPAPGVSATPLPRIGTTRTSVCLPILAASQRTVSNLTGNDGVLDDLVLSLPKLHMDDWPRPKREYELAALRKTAAEIRSRVRDGFQSTSRIRAYAQTVRDSGKRNALTAYVDALDGTLGTQDKAGSDLARGLLIAEARKSVFESDLELARQMPAPAGTQELDAPETYRELTAALANRIQEYRADTKRAEKIVATRVTDVGC